MSDPYRPCISRREAVARLSAAALAGAAVVGGAKFFHDRRTVVAEARGIPDWRLPVPPGTPAGTAARGADPATNVRRCLEALGGMAAFVRPGERVLIKPNIGWDRIPAQAANTDPTVVAELVRLCMGAGAAQVVVTDIPVNDPRRCFARSGIADAARAAGARVVDTASLSMVPARLSGASAGIEVMEEVLLADRVINVPVVKHHSLSRVTIGLKNWFGVLGRGRNRLHQGIDRAIAELGAIFRPTLTVIDATRVLVASGPQGGSLADVREVGAVAAGVDPVALDAWGAKAMGVEPGSLPFLIEAERLGLGRADLRLVKEAGRA